MNGRITSGSREERAVAIGAQRAGDLPGPITRDAEGSDYRDAEGQRWDVVPVYRGRSFDALKSANRIAWTLARGTNALINIGRLSSAELEALRSEVSSRGWGKRVIYASDEWERLAFPDGDDEVIESDTLAALQRRVSGESGYQQMTIEGSDLRAWSFAGADLADVNLIDCDLRGCDFSGADLRRGYHAFSDFSGSNLTSATLYKADFSSATLLEANLSQVWAERATFEGASLVRSIAVGADFTRAYFAEADLRQADLRDAAIEEASLANARVAGVLLEGAVGLESIFAESLDIGPDRSERLAGASAIAWLQRESGA